VQDYAVVVIAQEFRDESFSKTPKSVWPNQNVIWMQDVASSWTPMNHPAPERLAGVALDEIVFAVPPLHGTNIVRLADLGFTLGLLHSEYVLSSFSVIRVFKKTGVILCD
jgi:hypothetical protein